MKTHALNKMYRKPLRTYRICGEILSPAAHRVLDDIIRFHGSNEKIYKELRYHLLNIARSAMIWPLTENHPPELRVKARLKGITDAIPD